MSLTERINNDIKEAMKSGEKDKLMALRDIKSKLLLEATKEGGDGGVDDTRVIAILNKLYKQRMESIDIYKGQGRQDLIDEETKQANVIAAYLPEQLTGEKLEAEVRAIVAASGASGPNDMGKAMGAANKALAGKADGKAISEIVKKILSGN
ncbi:MAG: GatB/YqeY domain-containing protein [Flavobacteriales bacterium]|nr:GatB/YqeY domain-containing protein [Flavobacteriales bacterium]